MSSNETQMTFFNAGGHNHDGINSTKVDFSKYSKEDIYPLLQLLLGTNLGGNIGGAGSISNDIGEPIPGTDGGVLPISPSPHPEDPTFVSFLSGIREGEDITSPIMYMEATWTPPTNTTNLGGYEVRVQPVGGTTEFQFDLGPSATTARFEPVTPGVAYEFFFRTITKWNVRGTAVGGIDTWLGPFQGDAARDTIPPPRPTGLLVFSTVKQFIVSWNDLPTVTDMGRGRGVWEIQVATNTAFSANLETFYTNGRVISISPAGGRGPRANPTNYYIRVRGRDTSDNAGTWHTYSTNGTGDASAIKAAQLGQFGNNGSDFGDQSISVSDIVAANVIIGTHIRADEISTSHLMADSINADKIVANLQLEVGQEVSSSDYGEGAGGVPISGWKLRSDSSGNSFFKIAGNADIGGNIRASSGNIGNWAIQNGDMVTATSNPASPWVALSQSLGIIAVAQGATNEITMGLNVAGSGYHGLSLDYGQSITASGSTMLVRNLGTGRQVFNVNYGNWNSINFDSNTGLVIRGNVATDFSPNTRAELGSTSAGGSWLRFWPVAGTEAQWGMQWATFSNGFGSGIVLEMNPARFNTEGGDGVASQWWYSSEGATKGDFGYYGNGTMRVATALYGKTFGAGNADFYTDYGAAGIKAFPHSGDTLSLGAALGGAGTSTTGDEGAQIAMQGAGNGGFGIAANTGSSWIYFDAYHSSGVRTGISDGTSTQDDFIRIVFGGSERFFFREDGAGIADLSWTTFSSRSVKDNILDVDKNDIIDRFKQLRVRSYDRKMLGSGRVRDEETGKYINIPFDERPFMTDENDQLIYNSEIGLIVEEVDQIFPEFTVEKSLNYAGMVTPVISVVQNILERLEALEIRGQIQPGGGV